MGADRQAPKFLFTYKASWCATLADIRRSAVIDLMRGICVLLVMLDHIDLRFRIKKFDVAWLAPEPVRQVLFHSGYFAVITFFVISGFLITSISRERWSSLNSVSVSQFYWLRFARIGPCLVLLVALLSVLHLAQVSEFVIKPDRGTLSQAVLAALTFHVNWLEGRQGYLPGSTDLPLVDDPRHCLCTSCRRLSLHSRRA